MKLRAYFAGILFTFACVAPAVSADDWQQAVEAADVVANDTDWHQRSSYHPISINGVEKKFLLDTGGILPQIAPTVADELKLHRRDSPLQFFAADGSVSKQEVVIDNFAMGTLHGSDVELQISPFAGVDGIFSPIGFKAYDFDMDFASGKLNIISNDHCDGQR